MIERGEGVWLYTTDGQKILDGMAGLWNVNVGYGREELAKAAYDQMKELAFTSNFSGMTNLPSIQLADKLAGFAYEGLNTTHFTSGGSEANDLPSRLRAITGSAKASLANIRSLHARVPIMA